MRIACEARMATFPILLVFLCVRHSILSTPLLMILVGVRQLVPRFEKDVKGRSWELVLSHVLLYIVGVVVYYN